MIQSYEQAHALARTRRRKLCNNTYLEVDRAPAEYAVRLHNTRIVTYHRNGRVVLDSGGWMTLTTRERMNTFGPAGWRVWQNKGIWYVGKMPWDDMVTCIFQDGIAIHLDSHVTGAGKNPKKTQKLRKAVRRYAKDFVAALRAGDVPKPSGGDCFECHFRQADGSAGIGGDHILEHMKEKYYVPSLLVNACKAFGVSQEAMHHIAYIWENQSDREWLGDFIWRQIEKAVWRHCYRELGLAS